MRKRLRWLKVVSFVGIAMGLLLAGELTQAIAESFLVKDEDAMTRLVNQHRRDHDENSLPTSPALRMVARRQAQRMVAAGFIYHNPDLQEEAENALPGWLALGENVGVGPEMRDVFEAFLDSAPHHRNIDYDDYNIVAIGAMAGDDGALFFTQNFARHSSAQRLREKERAEREKARRKKQKQEERAREQEQDPPAEETETEEPAEASPSPTPDARDDEQAQAASDGDGISNVFGGVDFTEEAVVLGVKFLRESDPEPDPAPASGSGVTLVATIFGMLGRAVSNIGEGLARLAFWR